MALQRVDQIDQCLPQTQCTQCSYPGCKEYAQAIDSGEADINQCPPGGEITITALAKLLERPIKPLNLIFGQHKPKTIARIIEVDCIGCTLCIKACPVDAIIGSAKFMHSVITTECTGCELCVDPCPMDCIKMEPPTDQTQTQQHPWPDYSQANANNARLRRQEKLSRESNPQTKIKRRIIKPDLTTRQQMINDAIARAKAKSK